MWAVLQSAETQVGEVKKPDIPQNHKILEIKPGDRGHYEDSAQFGNRVSGRKIIEADHVVYIDTSNIGRITEINRSLENYVLIFTGNFNLLAHMVSFADYSNAAAIICLGDVKHNSASHFNGALREAGIVLLAGDVDEKFREGLNMNGVTNRKLLVYANDAEEEGFVATLD